jgi:hypothetical protein
VAVERKALQGPDVSTYVLNCQVTSCLPVVRPKCGLVKSSRERYRLLAIVGSQNGDSGKNEDVDEPCLESPER